MWHYVYRYLLTSHVAKIERAKSASKLRYPLVWYALLECNECESQIAYWAPWFWLMADSGGKTEKTKTKKPHTFMLLYPKNSRDSVVVLLLLLLFVYCFGKKIQSEKAGIFQKLVFALTFPILKHLTRLLIALLGTGSHM